MEFGDGTIRGILKNYVWYYLDMPMRDTIQGYFSTPFCYLSMLFLFALLIYYIFHKEFKSNSKLLSFINIYGIFTFLVMLVAIYIIPIMETRWWFIFIAIVAFIAIRLAGVKLVGLAICMVQSITYFYDYPKMIKHLSEDISNIDIHNIFALSIIFILPICMSIISITYLIMNKQYMATE